MGKVILILGILGVILGGAVAVISLILPQVTRNVSMDEALIGVAAGIAVLVFSFVPVVIGFVLMRIKKKKLNSQM